jgi:hypothetical protein
MRITWWPSTLGSLGVFAVIRLCAALRMAVFSVSRVVRSDVSLAALRSWRLFDRGGVMRAGWRTAAVASRGALAAIGPCAVSGVAAFDAGRMAHTGASVVVVRSRVLVYSIGVA